jgi:hypothetical protein
MIRPEFWEDTKIAQLSSYARLFFIALWNFADDEGYLENNPAWLKAKCFPYDKVNIEKLTEELIKSGRILIQNGIISILNFLKHQRIEKPRQSVLKIQFGEDSGNGSGTVGESSTTKEKLSEEKLSEEKILYVDFEKSTINLWNLFCEKHPFLSKITTITDSRRKSLKARFAQNTFKDFPALLAAIEDQPFLLNGNPDSKDHKNWKISFDWLIRNDINHVKVLEKKYMNNRSNQWWKQ